MEHNEGTITLLKNQLRKNIVYKVKSGDTLQSIAQAYNTTVQTILSVNGINFIDEGDRVFIPKENATTYVVKPLDTVNLIAERFNVTPEYIKKENNIGDAVFIGQILVI